MSSLIPTHASSHVIDGLSEYLATSFSLAEPSTAAGLKEFLTDPEHGMFHGPYVRTRLPYAPAENWEGTLDWLPDGFVPYRHQAEAFERLASIRKGEERRPEPTLVVTGTGSGKTESFLYPILNHCLRAAGTPGIKALILYPMNALANDQAARLTTLLTTDPRLSEIRAGLYTGEASESERQKISEAGLITDRAAMRQSPPDILLTNYKMLDQLLLRDDDQNIWEASANCLQYVVLDEFHTYDGAQGTDVALLLRRMGLKLKSLRQIEMTAEEQARPLGWITPVATSATLGDNSGEPTEMLRFAHTVFGEKLPAEAVVGDTIQTTEQWQRTIAEVTGVGAADTPEPSLEVIEEINASIAEALAGDDTPGGESENREEHDRIVHRVFCEKLFGLAGMDHSAESEDSPECVRRAVAAASRNAWIIRMLEATSAPIALTEPVDSDADAEDVRAKKPLDVVMFSTEALRRLGAGAVEFLAHTLTEIAHLRAAFGQLNSWDGKKFPGVDTHVWVREISRIDRAVVLGDPETPMFRWSDNGTGEGYWLPACYCRNCGRSGWMASMQPGDEFIDTTPSTIRGQSLRNPALMRPLIDATSEMNSGHTRVAEDHSMFAWLDLPNARLSSTEPNGDQLDLGGVVPVLTYGGDDIDDLARHDTCPSCGERDSIRYLGSSVATLLSVAVSNLFGMDDLDSTEKKSLVFTDSVQDAAHRAGFMQSRARTFAFRGRTNAVISGEATLDTLPRRLIESADADAVPARARFELLPPWVSENPHFTPFWDTTYPSHERGEATKRLTKVLELDLALEFGDRADLARSLVSTGTVSVGVNVDDDVLRPLAEKALEQIEQTALFHATSSESTLAGVGTPLAWARGVLEYTRLSGGIYTTLLKSYIESDCNSYLLNRREASAKGVPRFPLGGAPHFPRSGPRLSGSKANNSVLPVADERGWFARWSAKHLKLSARDAAHAVGTLFRLLARERVLGAQDTDTAGTVYYLEPSRIRVVHEHNPEILECTVCHRRFGVDAHGRELLAHSPCHSLGCEGHFTAVANPHNYYRSLYSSRDTRTVISREHTGLLEAADRLEVEEQFKASVDKQKPDAPNVLVATPTLEMGIDIGDLSAVMLASLPRSVASYVQRVGRAGRLSGNSLIIAIIRGRGTALARLERPLETINGAVQPPAAFLSAREILHRQFLAYIIDTLDFAEIGVAAEKAESVFGTNLTNAGKTVISALTDRFEAGVEDELAAFISALGEFAPEPVKEELREWARTHAVGELREKQASWVTRQMTLRERIHTMRAALKELDARSNGASADEETALQLRDARAAMRFLTIQFEREFKEKHWIAALEEVGLLPNFTLLDDSVEFEVSISRTDAETQEIETTAREYTRGVSSALFELAPDATFYVQGIAATVDSVELGDENSAIQTWRMCPSCSYSEINTEAATGKPCPQCGEPRFADAAQVLDVVEMTRVYASVDYSRSAITDSRDDRASVRFERALSMVIPDSGYGESWFLENTGFGIRYLSSVEMRWLNLGRGIGGPRQPIGGMEIETPLFRVCRVCGHKDSEAGSNRWQDHKPWCSLRHAVEEDTVAFALARRLNTQGVLMHLPPSIAAVNENVTPSLIAAIRMGFKLALGGNPDHLDVASVKASSRGRVIPMLLLHDTVPGGTGYLAQFTSTEDIRALLLKTYEALTDCACAGDNRQACPECLLPFSFGGDVNKVSRESALAAITKILLDDLHPEEDANPRESAEVWKTHITTEEPELSQRSALEVMFLEQLRADLKATGATVKERTSGTYAHWDITFPNSRYTWKMKEQERDPKFGNTIPDFSFKTEIEDSKKENAVSQIATFLDGYQYHASAENNRVASDIAKRNTLHERGYQPWVITHKDLEDRAKVRRGHTLDAPTWFNPSLRGALNSALQIDDTFHDNLRRDPMSQLLAILRNPTGNWASLGEAAVGHLVSSSQSKGPGILGSAADVCYANNILHITYLPNEAGSDKDSWNQFLRAANVSLLGGTRAVIDVHGAAESSDIAAAVESGSEAAGGDADTAAALDAAELRPAWREALDEMEDDDEAVAALRVLASAGVPAPSSVGEELYSHPTVATWELTNTDDRSEVRVALLFNDAELPEPWVGIPITDVEESAELPAVFERLRRLS